MTAWTAADIPAQTDRLAIVTGTGGLGLETALALAGAGADVVVAGRNPGKGADAVERIRRAFPAATVRFELLDLASLASVAGFADRLIAADKPVDLLVNNAAVMQLPTRQLTADGFEMQFGTNYLGHFALTGRLLPLLVRGRQPRVVNLSSLAHRQGKIDLGDLQQQRRYRPWAAYCQSKLAMLMFSLELQRRSDRSGWGVMSTAAHPGYARTDLIANGPGANALVARLGVILRPLSHSAAAGALPTLYAATAPDAQPGGYYGPNGFYEMKGAPAPAFVSKRAQDPAVAGRLWTVSEQLTAVSFPTAPARAAA